MKHIFSFLLFSVLISSNIFALPVRQRAAARPVLQRVATYEEPTIIMSPESIGNNIQYSFTQDNIKVECTKGAQTDTYFGCNADESITFTADEPIVSLSINGFLKEGFSATVSGGDLETADASEGEAETNPVLIIRNINNKTVTINCLKQLRCYSVSFYFEDDTEEVIGGNAGGNTDEPVIDILPFTDMQFVFYESEGSYDYMLYISDPASDNYIGLNFFSTDGKLENIYGSDDQTLGLDYSYIYIAAEDEEEEGDYISFKSASLMIVANEDGTYSITYEITTNGGNFYTKELKGLVPVYDGNYPNEPITKQDDINLELTHFEIFTDYIEYYGLVYLSVFDADTTNELSLCYSTTNIDFTEFEDGEYVIDNGMEDGTFLTGYYSYFTDMDGCLLFTYDTDNVYYLKEGTITFATSDDITTITIAATSKFGTKVSATCTYSSSQTGIGTTQADNDAVAVKYFDNNDIRIRRNGKVYNLQGMTIK